MKKRGKRKPQWERLIGKAQKTGHLKVLSFAGRTADRSALLLCECLLCGGQRTVDQRQFTHERVTKCANCADPRFRQGQQRTTQLLQERSLGIDPVYDDELFMRSWKDKIKTFNFDQRVLYETIINGRKATHIGAEAVDIVLREDDPVWALNFYSEVRQLAGEIEARRVFDCVNPKFIEKYQKAA